MNSFISANKLLLSNTLQIFISGTLIIWVLNKVDFLQLIANIRTMQVSFFVLAFLAWQLGVVQRTWRWQILLQGAGSHISFRRLVTLNYHALFFNSFLPTGIGSEIVRIITIEQEANLPRGQVGSLTIVDRLIGIITASMVAGFMLPFVWNILPASLNYSVILISLGSALLLILLLNAKRISTNGFIFRNMSEENIILNAFKTLQHLQDALIFKALTVSFTHTAFIIFIHFLVSKANHIDIGIWPFAVFTPLVTTSAILPSIQGFGVRESMYILLLGRLSVPESQAVLVGFGANMLNFLTGLGSGLINLFWPIQNQS